MNNPLILTRRLNAGDLTSGMRLPRTKLDPAQNILKVEELPDGRIRIYLPMDGRITYPHANYSVEVEL